MVDKLAPSKFSYGVWITSGKPPDCSLVMIGEEKFIMMLRESYEVTHSIEGAVKLIKEAVIAQLRRV